ncbi:alpha/beta hydrolase family esterase [Corynebacterium sp.]|uniref:alpha/beta hydrolase family esterase n=1 Tax=Corynebacterium sp. TaxID=1720 RepID=UPI003F95EFA7
MPLSMKRPLTTTLSTALATALVFGGTAALIPASGAVPGSASGSATGSTTGSLPQPDSGTALDALPSAGCGTEQTPGNDEYSLDSGGEERTYRLNVPRAYDESTPTPLILGFHGNGSDGAEFQNYTGLTDLPAVTAFPDGVASEDKRSWQGAPYASGADDLQFVSDLLDSIEDEHCIDLNRVYATGKSNGGGLVSLLACNMRDRFSAFASVAGAYYPQSTEGCSYDVPTPMLAIHGTGDATMQYDGGERQGETYPGVRDWLDPWTDVADCGAMTERQIGEWSEDVVLTGWADCDSKVELYSVADGGHVWPGEDMYSGGGYVTEHFSATDTMWRFFIDNPEPVRAL